MRPVQLLAFLVEMFRARENVLVVGEPGIGKSDIVAQAIRAISADCIMSHPAVEDPTDAKGFPFPAPDGTTATFLPFGNLARALAATGPTVWVLEDFGQAPPSVQTAYMQLLLGRRLNGHVLPDHVTFVACTNDRTHRAGVSGILEPVKSRFASIVRLETSVDDWSMWALGPGNMPVEVVAFLRFRPELLSAFQPSADLTNSPSPRTWAAVGRMLGRAIPPAIMHEAIAGAVGEGAAVEFAAFRAMLAELPNIDAILIDPDGAKIPDKPSARYAVVTGLAARGNVQTIGAIARYAERLVDATAGEFAALLLRDVLRRDRSVEQTPDFVRLYAGPLGQLISGAIITR